MRTSAGGRKLPAFDRDQWEKVASIPSGGAQYRCEGCGKLMSIIPNPAPNTVGGDRPLRLHQRLCGGSQ